MTDFDLEGYEQEVYDYARTHLGLLDPDQDDILLEDWARDHDWVQAYADGWLNPRDPETYDADIVADMAERIGLTLGPDQRTVDTYHDEQQHGGAVRWCTHPLCAGEQEKIWTCG